MNANKVTFPVCGIILKSYVNPINQTWEVKLRKKGKFRGSYSLWVYELNDIITKIQYEIRDYYGETDIYMIENKTELNNLWKFCERLQKKNPSSIVHLGLLPLEGEWDPDLTEVIK